MPTLLLLIQNGLPAMRLRLIQTAKQVNEHFFHCTNASVRLYLVRLHVQNAVSKRLYPFVIHICSRVVEHLIRLPIGRLKKRLRKEYTCFLDCRSNTSVETRLNIERAKAASFPSPGVVPNPKARLLDQVREVLRLKHYSIRTEEAYVQWIKRFIFFHGKRHPREMGAREIEMFLTDLAVRGKVAASTQNQALNALVFLYKEVLHIELGEFSAVRAKRSQRLPVVLTKDEASKLLAAMKSGTVGLMVRLLYGTGMRLMECVRLRVKDVLFEENQIVVRDGKGAKDRVTMLP